MCVCVVRECRVTECAASGVGSAIRVERAPRKVCRVSAIVLTLMNATNPLLRRPADAARDAGHSTRGERQGLPHSTVIPSFSPGHVSYVQSPFSQSP